MYSICALHLHAQNDDTEPFVRNTTLTSESDPAIHPSVQSALRKVSTAAGGFPGIFLKYPVKELWDFC